MVLFIIVIALLTAACFVLALRRTAIADNLREELALADKESESLRKQLATANRETRELRSRNGALTKRIKNLEDGRNKPSDDCITLDGPLVLTDRLGRPRSDRQLYQSALMACADEVGKNSLVKLDREKNTFTVTFLIQK